MEKQNDHEYQRTPIYDWIRIKEELAKLRHVKIHNDILLGIFQLTSSMVILVYYSTQLGGVGLVFISFLLVVTLVFMLLLNWVSENPEVEASRRRWSHHILLAMMVVMWLMMGYVLFKLKQG